MGKQFKTIPSVSRQISEDLPQSTEKESVNANASINSAGGVRPLLRLPMASSSTARSQDVGAGALNTFAGSASPQTPRPGVLDNHYNAPGAFQSNPPSQAGPFSAPPGMSSIRYAGAQQSRSFPQQETSRGPDSAAPFSWPGGSPKEFETPRAGYERAQTPRTRIQAPSKKRKKRGPASLVAVLSCCLCLLVLAGSGYWIYHTHNPASTSAPIAAPTQTKYTIAQPAPTSATTATAVPTASGTPASRIKIPALSPVPAPWQASGPLIVVSILKQKLTAYFDGKPKLTTLVTTGMPTLYTPEGTYHIIGRVANSMFYSPWPPSSPNYYAPIHVNYGLQLTSSGIYLHDATWRSVFGPGTNVPHTDPVYGKETGSHGCVELPLTAMKWLYNWAPNGIAVAVVD